MLDPIATYDPDITVFYGAHHADEKYFWAKTTNQSIICATDWGACEFILHVVKDTWRRHLKDTKTFYLHVTPLDLLKILAEHGGRIEHSDVITLLLILPTFWRCNPYVPDYINSIEDAQKKTL